MRFLAAFASLLAAFALATPAWAQVTLSFHSFNGSMFGGHYPHAFIVLEGTDDATGERINANYGFTAIHVTPALLSGSVEGAVESKGQDYLRGTNRHFSIRLSAAQFTAVMAEIHAWRDRAGKDYNLNSRNCIHFVAAIARVVGLTSDVPAQLTKKPRAWLNYVTRMNPQLGAREIG